MDSLLSEVRALLKEVEESKHDHKEGECYREGYVDAVALHLEMVEAWLE